MLDAIGPSPRGPDLGADGGAQAGCATRGGRMTMPWFSAARAAMRTAYLAGPMSNIPLYNQPAFLAAAAAWRAGGYEVTTPFDTNSIVWRRHFDREFNPATDKCDYGDPLLNEMLAEDMAAMLSSDTIVLLPGWRESTGARAEMVVACLARKRAIEHESGIELHIAPVIAWHHADRGHDAGGVDEAGDSIPSGWTTPRPAPGVSTVRSPCRHTGHVACELCADAPGPVVAAPGVSRAVPHEDHRAGAVLDRATDRFHTAIRARDDAVTELKESEAAYDVARVANMRERPESDRVLSDPSVTSNPVPTASPAPSRRSA